MNNSADSSYLANPPTTGDQRDHRVPPQAATFGMWLFLAALFMLFAASIIGYVIIRTTSSTAPAWGAVQVPWGLWVSTAVIMVSSISMHMALHRVRQGELAGTRIAMLATLGLAIAFVAVQSPSLVILVQEHQAVLASAEELKPAMALYGLMVALIVVHALHVLGGVIPMLFVTAGAMRGRYNENAYGPIKHLTMYWHFLDAVWIVMFAMFLLTK